MAGFLADYSRTMQNVENAVFVCQQEAATRASYALTMRGLRSDVLFLFLFLHEGRCWLTFCVEGAECAMSFIRTGMSSVTRWTPAAKVPSLAEPSTGWPWALACSSHLRVTESTTYSTPNLWSPSVFLK